METKPMRDPTVFNWRPYLVFALVGALFAAGLPFFLGPAERDTLAVGGGAGPDATVVDGGAGGDPGTAGGDPAVPGGPAGGGAGPSGGTGGSGGAGGGGTGGGTGGGPGGGGGGTGPGAPGETPRASDVGVSATDVKVSVLIMDSDGLAAAGFGVEADHLKRQLNVFLQKVNASGGVNGRKLDVYYRHFDPLNPDDMSAACIDVTENRRSFAVLNLLGYFGQHILCITEQHKTFFYAGEGEMQELYTRAKGLHVSVNTNTERILRNYVAELHKLGLLAGKKIGVVDTANASDRVPSERALLPTLQQYGYTVTHRTTLSADFGTAQGQIPLEVQRMRTAGVDVVLPIMSFIYATTWVQEASSQAYDPDYFTSDFAGGSADFYTKLMPDSFHGTIGITGRRTGEARVGRPEPALDRQCRTEYEQASGETLQPGSDSWQSAALTCGFVRTFAEALRRAGINPTRSSLTRGFESFGAVELPMFGGGSFRPGKLDAVDYVRTVRWDVQCKCYKPTDDFRRGEF